MGATADGRKELIAVQDRFRESEQSWLSMLLDLKQRGLTIDPKLAIADGALGFWAACRKVWPTTRQQRCWGARVIPYPPPIALSDSRSARVWQLNTHVRPRP